MFYLLAGRQPSDNDLFLSSTGYLYEGISLWAATALIFFASATAGRRRWYIFPFLGTTILLLGFYGARGTRIQMLPLVIAVPVFWYLWNDRRPKFRTLLAVSLVGFAMLGWLREIREADQRGEVLAKLGSALAAPVREAGDILKGLDADMFDTLANALVVVPEHLPFRHGAIVTDVLIRIVPRPIWPDKPLESNDALLRTLWPIHYSLSRAGPASSLMGSFYADSGIVTVAFGMYLTGALFAMLWCWLQRYRSAVIAQMVYSMGLPFVVILMRGSVPDTLARMLFMFVPLVLLMMLGSLRDTIAGKIRKKDQICHRKNVLLINTAFSEMDYLAAKSARNGLLSRYVRPYAYKGRPWERAIASLPGAGDFYFRTIGRRRLPKEFPAAFVHEAAVALDVALALAHRFKGNFAWAGQFEVLINARTPENSNTGAKPARECAVVASWGCAEPAFHRMKANAGLCILDYPLAHHRFTRTLLLEEAELEPSFAGTLNSHDWPKWLEERFDVEIALADHILVGSSFVRDSFTAEGISAEKLAVIPYGADTQAFPARNQKAPNGLFQPTLCGTDWSTQGNFLSATRISKVPRSKNVFDARGQDSGG